MGHDLFFHVLLLLGLLCLCRLLDWVWTWGRPTTGQATPALSLPFTQRSKAPKPFPELTHKPRCDACEHAAESRQQVPSALPPRLTYTQGRRRAIDTQPQRCPAYDCAYYGGVGRGNIRANGHPGGSPWRQL